MSMEPNNDIVRDVLAGFDGVWKRVSGSMPGAAPPQEKSEPVPLARLAADAAAIAAYDRALAQRFHSGTRAMLLARTQQSRNVCSRLEAEIFLRSGERPRIKAAPPVLPRDDMAALRQSMLADEAAALSFDAAAEREHETELAALLRDYARRSRGAAAEKRAWILRSFR